MVASTNAACPLFASWQAPPPPAPLSRYGVARPAALVGCGGTMSEQLTCCCCCCWLPVFFWLSDGCVPPLPRCAASGACAAVVGEAGVVGEAAVGAALPPPGGCGAAPACRLRPVIAPVRRERTDAVRDVRALLFDVEDVSDPW